MPNPSQAQKERLSSIIDRLFPGYSGKAGLMANIADERGDFSNLSEMSDSEIEEMVSMEKEFLGG